MDSSEYSDAINQLAKLESFANVEDNLKDPPVSMPQDRMRAAGIDPDLWCGLGIVGVWAAVDAFGERRFPSIPMRSGLLRLVKHVAKGQDKILAELDDLRSLFAHNFAGIADHKYLSDKRRLSLKLDTPYHLSCGYQFNGQQDERITLTLSDLKYYITEAREILECLNDRGQEPLITGN
jgi:hypothetical protein